MNLAPRSTMPQHILVLGATSAIAEATLRHWAADGAVLFLAARHGGKLQSIADDLRTRHGDACVAGTWVADFDDDAGHRPMLDAAHAALGGAIDLVFIAHGRLPDQRLCEQQPEQARRAFVTNALSVISLCAHAANLLETRRGATIAVITSVAGDRGRRSNHVYGASKAMVSVFLEGLRCRLHAVGVHVVDIRPGFVATPMTAGLQRRGPLWSEPERVARGIVKVVREHRAVAYLPARWYWIMAVVRMIPEPWFRRLEL